MNNIYFKEISSDNLYEICKLSETLSEKQKKCVAPNSYSIAEAHYSDVAWFRAIYIYNTPIGFIMVEESGEFDTEEYKSHFLWRFMIAKDYQGKGYGEKSIELLIEHLKSKGINKLYTSCCPLTENDESPEHFYKKLGFTANGKTTDDGEEIILEKLL